MITLLLITVSAIVLIIILFWIMPNKKGRWIGKIIEGWIRAYKSTGNS